MADLLGNPEPTLQDMLGCAHRELRMRRSVYPRWVQIKRMTAEEARREIAIMEAIVAHFEAQMRAGNQAGRS